MFRRKPAGSEENPLEEDLRGRKPTAEEHDLSEGWKKTPPKKTLIFKPAELPHYRDGVEKGQHDRRKLGTLKWYEEHAE